MTQRYLNPNLLSIPSAMSPDAEDGAGGIVTFIGTPRGYSSGNRVHALEYEAFEEMAQDVLEQIIAQAHALWPLKRVHVEHRLGVVHLGEPSIVVQVGAAHRAEAFAACQYIVDRIKHDAPIWKKEIHADGSRSWVHCDGSPGTPAVSSGVGAPSAANARALRPSRITMEIST